MEGVPKTDDRFALQDCKADAVRILEALRPIETLIDALDLACTGLEDPAAPILCRHAGDALEHVREAMADLNVIRTWL